MNFTEQLNEVGIVLNDTQRSQFDKYFEILVEWNGFMNLTGITEYEDCLLYTSPNPRDVEESRMPSSA